MAAPAIKVEHLSKRYYIGANKGNTMLREQIMDALASPFRNLARFGQSSTSETDAIWALKDVSFEVEPGEVVGVIGRNGAGKSTLLKILTRITEPTEGRAEFRGRIGSLLEIGTGFHPELTGRENIFLSGAIRGMTRAEIKKYFDEIVEFSGVEKFLDTPVKRYSSGMHVRLGFAIAAHLQPEILLVDEVLAVGDVEFQKKCLGKMGDVAKSGRTILFVSHNMNAIEKLCSRCMLLKNGELKCFGETGTVIPEYLSGFSANVSSCWVNPGNEYDNRWFKPIRALICDGDGTPLRGPVSNTQQCFFRIEGEVKEVNNKLLLGFNLYDHKETLIFVSMTCDASEEQWPKVHVGRNILQVPLPRRILNEGQYVLRPFGWIHKLERLFDVNEDKAKLSYEILGGLSDSSMWTKNRGGFIAPVLKWELQRGSSDDKNR